MRPAAPAAAAGSMPASSPIAPSMTLSPDFERNLADMCATHNIRQLRSVFLGIMVDVFGSETVRGSQMDASRLDPARVAALLRILCPGGVLFRSIFTFLAEEGDSFVPTLFEFPVKRLPPATIEALSSDVNALPPLYEHKKQLLRQRPKTDIIPLDIFEFFAFYFARYVASTDLNTYTLTQSLDRNGDFTYGADAYRQLLQLYLTFFLPHQKPQSNSDDLLKIGMSAVNGLVSSVMGNDAAASPSASNAAAANRWTLSKVFHSSSQPHDQLEVILDRQSVGVGEHERASMSEVVKLPFQRRQAMKRFFLQSLCEFWLSPIIKRMPTLTQSQSVSPVPVKLAQGFLQFKEIDTSLPPAEAVTSSQWPRRLFVLSYHNNTSQLLSHISEKSVGLDPATHPNEVTKIPLEGSTVFLDRLPRDEKMYLVIQRGSKSLLLSGFEMGEDVQRWLDGISTHSLAPKIRDHSSMVFTCINDLINHLIMDPQLTLYPRAPSSSSSSSSMSFAPSAPASSSSSSSFFSSADYVPNAPLPDATRRCLGESMASVQKPLYRFLMTCLTSYHHPRERNLPWGKMIHIWRKFCFPWETLTFLKEKGYDVFLAPNSTPLPPPSTKPHPAFASSAASAVASSISSLTSSISSAASSSPAHPSSPDEWVWRDYIAQNFAFYSSLTVMFMKLIKTCNLFEGMLQPTLLAEFQRFIALLASPTTSAVLKTFDSTVVAGHPRSTRRQDSPLAASIREHLLHVSGYDTCPALFSAESKALAHDLIESAVRFIIRQDPQHAQKTAIAPVNTELITTAKNLAHDLSSLFEIDLVGLKNQQESLIGRNIKAGAQARSAMNILRQSIFAEVDMNNGGRLTEHGKEQVRLGLRNCSKRDLQDALRHQVSADVRPERLSLNQLQLCKVLAGCLCIILFFSMLVNRAIESDEL